MVNQALNLLKNRFASMYCSYSKIKKSVGQHEVRSDDLAFSVLHGQLDYALSMRRLCLIIKIMRRPRHFYYLPKRFNSLSVQGLLRQIRPSMSFTNLVHFYQQLVTSALRSKDVIVFSCFSQEFMILEHLQEKMRFDVQQIQSDQQVISISCKCSAVFLYQKFASEVEEAYQCRSMSYIMRMRKLIQQSNYLKLQQKDVTIGSHILQILIRPALHLLEQWRQNACKGCRVTYRVGIQRYDYLFGRIINGKVTVGKRNEVLLFNIQGLESRLTIFEKVNKCLNTE